MWIKRDFESIWPPKAGQPISVLVGPRQCGKSSVLERCSENDRRKVTLDDVAVRDEANQNPRLFLDQLGPKALIDEVQYAPPLFPEMKLRVDAMKKERLKGSVSNPLSYWLTGSNRLLLDNDVSESLTGRATYYRFNPLSLTELKRAFGAPSLSSLLIKGGWPELWAQPELDSIAYLNDHIQTTLEKDLVRTAGIQKVNEFLRVIRLLAGRVGGLFVASELGRDAGVRASTVIEWVSFVERMLYVAEVPSFASSRTTRLIKASKYYFLDTAILVRLQGWAQVEPILVSPNVGAMFENLVFSEIVKTRDLHQKTWEVFHYRTKEKEEVDFLVSDGQHMVAIECKMSSRQASAVIPPKSFHVVPAKKFFAVSFDKAERGKEGVEPLSIFDLPARLMAELA